VCSSDLSCSARQDASHSQGPTILIVEDERVSRQALAFLLESCGYRSEPCGSAEEALQHVDHDGAPPFALVDLDLPGMNGIDLLTRLEQLNPRMVKVLMTAAEGERIERFRRDHKVYYMRKPLDFRRLLNLLDAEPDAPHQYC